MNTYEKISTIRPNHVRDTFAAINNRVKTSANRVLDVYYRRPAAEIAVPLDATMPDMPKFPPIPPSVVSAVSDADQDMSARYPVHRKGLYRDNFEVFASASPELLCSAISDAANYAGTVEDITKTWVRTVSESVCDHAKRQAEYVSTLAGLIASNS